MDKYSTKELLAVWLDSFTELSFSEKETLFEKLKDAVSIKEVLKSELKTLPQSESAKLEKLIGSTDNGYLRGILERLCENGVYAVTRESDIYPEELKNTEDAPFVLYCKGNADLLRDKKFSIVGSRKSLPLSIELAKRYAFAAAECGFTLVTGIAEGVDKAVLDTAIDNGLKVISVLASGLDSVYPKAHEHTADRLAEENLIISEYPLGVSAKRFHFPFRNRIIAALSDGVLIVSGGERSGTAHTAGYALEYGKELFAIPYSVGVASGKTPNTLIKNGFAHLTDDPNDLFEFYNVEKKTEKEEFSDEEIKVMEQLKDGKIHVEKIAEKLKTEVWKITPVLSMLEIKGKIIKNGNNEYSVI